MSWYRRTPDAAMERICKINTKVAHPGDRLQQQTRESNYGLDSDDRADKLTDNECGNPS